MPEARRSSLPFGAVMATGAASQLAVPAGVGALRLPLLWVTVAVAVAVSVAAVAGAAVAGGGTCGRRRPRRQPGTRFGDFTVPIGLAVIGAGLARLGGPGVVAGAGAVAAAWAATVVLVAMVVVPVVASPPGRAAVDGAWFLAPAALLADGVGVAAVAVAAPGHGPVEGWLAVAAAGVGAVGYLLVLGLAAARVAAHGLAGVPRAPWWIAAGCAGLSAAAIGRAGSLLAVGGAAGVLRGFGWAALGFWVVGSVALLPVLAGSARFLARLRRAAGRPPWPPTFSTGVYALGAGQAGGLLHVAAVTRVADGAAVVTVCLWALTVVAHLPVLARLLQRRGRTGRVPSP